jgi:hypothetical protein
MKKFLLGIAFALVACSSFAQPTLKLEPSKLDMKAGDVQEITVSVVGAEAWAYCAAQFVITLPEGVELGGKYMNGYTEEKVADEYAKYLKKNKKTDSEETYKEFLKEKESTYFIETLFPSSTNPGAWQVPVSFTTAPHEYTTKDPKTNQDVYWRTSTTNELNVVIMTQTSETFPDDEVESEPLFKFPVIATDRTYTGTYPIDINYVTFTTDDKKSVPVADATVGELTYTIDYTIPAGGFGTLVWPLALDMSANEFTVGTGELNGTNMKPIPVEGKKIAGNEPVIIIGKAGTYSLTTVPKDQSASVAKVTGNVLEGTVDKPLKVEGSNIFALAEKNGVLGFYRCDEGVEIPQYKAYYTGSATVDSYPFEVDGINNIVADELSGDAYTISGVKVNNTSKKGVYIVNGKKVVVK